MATQIKLRRDTYENWYGVNPTLAIGEPAYDTTNNKLKIGDGNTDWRTLSYLTDATGDFSGYATQTWVTDQNYITLADVPAELPASAAGVLTNDGTGVLSWSTGGAADLGNLKITGGIIGTVDNPNTGGWGGYDIGIDPGGESWAGLYIPGLVNQESGAQLQIYNTKTINSQISLSAQGGVLINVANGLTYNFQADGKFKLPAGGDIVDSSGVSVLGGGGPSPTAISNGLSSVSIPVAGGAAVVSVNNGGAIYEFNPAGELVLPATGSITQTNSYTKTVDADILSGPSAVVWSSTNNGISSAKLIIQVECDEVGDSTGWHSQVCEAIISSRGWANAGAGTGDPQMVVYGVVHTSVDVLMTFTAQRNPTSHLIEVVGTMTAAASGTPYLKIHSVEMLTRD